MQLDLTIGDIDEIIKKQLSGYEVVYEYIIGYITNYILIHHNGVQYTITLNKNDNITIITYKYTFATFVFFKNDIDDSIAESAMFAHRYEYFNNNKYLILNVICKYITDTIVANIKVFNIRTEYANKQNTHCYNMNHIEEYCRSEKLKIAKNV